MDEKNKKRLFQLGANENVRSSRNNTKTYEGFGRCDSRCSNFAARRNEMQ